MLKRTLKGSKRGLDRVSLVEKWPFRASFQSIMSQIFDPSNPLFPRDTAFGQTMGTHRSQISTEAFFSRISFTDGISPLSLPLGGYEAFKRKIYSQYHLLPSKMKTYFLGSNPYWHRCISICYLFDKWVFVFVFILAFAFVWEISDEGAYLYLLLFFELSSVSTTRGNIGVCRGRELILAPVRLFVISVHFNWPPIRLGPPPSLSGVIKPNHLGDYSQQGRLLRCG